MQVFAKQKKTAMIADTRQPRFQNTIIIEKQKASCPAKIDIWKE